MNAQADHIDTLRVEASFKNARLYNLMRERVKDPDSRGIVSQFCREHGFSTNETRLIYGLLRLTMKPLSSPTGGFGRPVFVARFRSGVATSASSWCH